MKRKLLAALLAALCALSACTAAPQPSPAPQPPEAPAQPAEPETPDTPDIPEIPDTPEEPPAAQTPNVTAGGVTVATDYSAYTPYAAPAAIYTRLTDAPLPDLVPGDDYGWLCPFVGAPLYSNGEDGYAWVDGALYGLIDASGRIVADPTYTSVSRLTSYSASGQRELDFWLLGRAGEVQEVELEGGWSYFDGGECYALAALDGSFVTPCCYGYVIGLGDWALCRTSWDSTEFTIYDASGRVVLTGRDVDFLDRAPEYGLSIFEGGCGRAVVELADGYYYMDQTGALVLGPYDTAQGFVYDRAAVGFADPGFGNYGCRYGVIDLDGRWILEPAWTGISTDNDAGILAMNSVEHVCALFDRDGTELFHTTGDHMNRASFGFEVYDWSSGTTRYIDPSGAPLAAPPGTNWWPSGSAGYFARETGTGLDVYDVRTGARQTLEGASCLWPLYRDAMTGEESGLGLYLAGFETDGKSEVRLYDAQLREVAAMGNCSLCALRDSVTGEEYVLRTEQGTGRQTLLDAALRPVAEVYSPYAAPRLVNGILLTTTQQATTARSLATGKCVFSYPLTAAMDD